MAIAHVGESITCSGAVTELVELQGERCVWLRLHIANARGDVKLKGGAVVALMPAGKPVGARAAASTMESQP